MISRFSFTFVVTALSIFPLFAEESPEVRRAWCIGIDQHAELPDLKNAGNDASLVGKVLAQHGYLLQNRHDSTLAEFKATLAAMRGQGPAAATVFFFAGHGLEVDGENYLLPADFQTKEAPTRELLARTSLPLSEVLEVMKEMEGIKLIVLDCCRDNPFSPGSGGLAPIKTSELPDETLLLYSGAPGTAVPDGEGDNSPFTEQLCAKATPGLPPIELAVLVQEELDTQKPWVAFNGAASSLKALMETPLLPGRRISLPEAKGIQVVEFGESATIRGYLARIKTYDRQGKAVFPFFLTTEKKLIVKPAVDFDPGSTGELLDGLELKILSQDDELLNSFNGKKIEIVDAKIATGLDLSCHSIGFFVKSPKSVRLLPDSNR